VLDLKSDGECGSSVLADPTWRRRERRVVSFGDELELAKVPDRRGLIASPIRATTNTFPEAQTQSTSSLARRLTRLATLAHLTRDPLTPYQPKMASLSRLLAPQSPAPASASASPPARLAYAPTKRVSPPDSVLVPISRTEIVQSQSSINPLRTRPIAPSTVDLIAGSSSSTGLPPRPSSNGNGSASGNGNGNGALKRANSSEDGSNKRTKGDVVAVASHCEWCSPAWSPPRAGGRESLRKLTGCVRGVQTTRGRTWT